MASSELPLIPHWFSMTILAVGCLVSVTPGCIAPMVLEWNFLRAVKASPI